MFLPAASLVPFRWRISRCAKLVADCCWWLFRSVLVLWVAVVLVAWGPLTTAVWQHGGHATPEQWAFHMVLDRLGLHQHHGRVLHAHDAYGLHTHSSEDTDPNLAPTHATADQIMRVVLPTRLPELTAPTSTMLLLQPLWHLVVARHAILPEPVVERILDWYDPPVHQGIIHSPPEKPPAAHFSHSSMFSV